jgi:hypothetical protein
MLKNELKEGDSIEILTCSGWSSRILLHVDKNGKAIVINKCYEAGYNKGANYAIAIYNSGDWRPIKPQEYTPFTFEDNLLGKEVSFKNNRGSRGLIMYQDGQGINIAGLNYNTYEYAFNAFVFFGWFSMWKITKRGK